MGCDTAISELHGRSGLLGFFCLLLLLLVSNAHGQGTVDAWGFNNQGQLGYGNFTNSSTPLPVAGGSLSGVIAVAAGGHHSVALKNDGTVWDWGSNEDGQLGNGQASAGQTPVQVPISGVVAITAGRFHTLAVKNDGTVWTWGDAQNVLQSVPIQVSGISGVVAIAASQGASFALRSDGTVWSWGSNLNGQLGIGTSVDSNSPVQITALSGIVAIAAGTLHALALRNDGTVWAWGDNGLGELGDGTTINRNSPVQVNGLSGVVAIFRGGYFNFAMKSDGTVLGWGANNVGQLCLGTVSAVSATYAIVPTPVTQSTALTGITAISGGEVHTLALKPDGTVWACGDNEEGQLGDGAMDFSSHPNPIQAINLSPATAISAGVDHSLALVLPPAGLTDLAITGTVSPANAAPGAQFTYTYTVVNNGPNTATGVTLFDPLPLNSVFVSATASAGTCAGSAAVICLLGNLGPSATATVTIVLTLNQTGVTTNTATVYSQEADPDLTNNSAAVSATVGIVDLSLSAGFTSLINFDSLASTLKPDSPLPGNFGSTPQVSVSYTSESTFPGAPNQPYIYWFGPNTYGDLSSAGSSALADVVLTAAAGTTVTLNSFELGGYLQIDRLNQTVQVSADGNLVDDYSRDGVRGSGPSHSTFDPDITGGVVTIHWGSEAGINNVSFLSSAPTSVDLSKNLTFDATVFNNSTTTTSTGITLTYNVPAGLTLLSATSATMSCTGTATLVCTQASLAPASAATASITVQAVNTGTISNTLTVTGNEVDPNTGNNSATFTMEVHQATPAVSLSASLANPVFSQPVTLTTSVTALPAGTGTPSGSVTFVDGGITLGTAPLDGAGNATWTTSSLGYGSHSLVANYLGNGNFSAASSPTLIEVVNRASSTISASSSLQASVEGQSVTLTATVAPVAPAIATPTGTVSFSDGLNTVVASLNASGIATYINSTLSVGSHTFTAFYSGDSNFNSSTSAPFMETVGKAATTVALSSSSLTVVSTQPVTFTITVTAVAPGSGIPSSSVTLSDGGTPLVTLMLDSTGIATFTTSTLTVGAHTITAQYAGDSNYLPSNSSAVTQSISDHRLATATALAAMPNPSFYGGNVTLVATVSVVPPNNGTPTQQVTFMDGGSTVFVGNLMATANGYQAVFVTSGLAIGQHTFSATYGGDGNFLSSTSATLMDTVNPAGTSVALASSAQVSVVNQPVTFTATVSVLPGGGGTPGHSVVFFDGGSPIATVPLISGTAAYTTNSLGLGQHSIIASYQGDSNFLPSTSSSFAQFVGTASTKIALASSPNPSSLGQIVMLTATVIPAFSGPLFPAGMVTFHVSGGDLGSALVNSSGVASLTIPTFTSGFPGTFSITASYQSADSNFSSSASSTLMQTVNPVPTTLTVVSSADPALAGQAISVTATLNFGTPVNQSVANNLLAQGPLQFQIGFSGTGNAGPSVPAPLVLNAPDSAGNYNSATATFNFAPGTVPTFPGTYTITAIYTCANSCTAAGSSASLQQIVQPIPTTSTITSSLNPSLAGQPLIFTVTINFAAPLSSSSLFGNSPGTITLQYGSASGTGTSFIPGIVQTPVLNPPDASGKYTSASASFATLPGSVFTLASMYTATATYSCPSTPQPGCLLAGSSSQLVQTVGPVPTTMVVASSPNPALDSQSIQVTATVNFAIPISYPTITSSGFLGFVQFSVDSASPGSGTGSLQLAPALGTPDAMGDYNSLSATFTFAPGAGSLLTAGTHTITAVYSCTTPGCLLAASSNSLQQTVDNTPVGNTPVSPVDAASGTSPVTVTFTNVTQPGLTTLSINNTGPSTPQGFELGNPATYYELSTTATFNPPAEVCINYGTVSFTNPSNLALMHYENGVWVDRTVSNDTVKQIICGDVSSFSPFVIFQRLQFPLVVTANDATRQYGSPGPQYSVSYAGFVDGDGPQALPGQLSCNSSDIAASPVGSYVIDCSSSTLSSPKYMITYKQGKLTITPAPLLLTADRQQVTYGSGVPALTYSALGFVNNDTKASLTTQPSLSTTATAASGISTYPIMISGAVDPNYTISYAPGTLIISPAVLTITAPITSKVLNSPNPAFRPTTNGFVNGDTTSVLTSVPSCATTALTTSMVGSYAITCSGGNAANYTFNYIPGTLKIVYSTAVGHIIQPPINSNGSSVFNQGRTIPAKFNVYDANGVSIGTPGVVSSFYLTEILSGTMTTPVQDVVDTNNPDAAFRWDSTAQQWVFNITTADLVVGSTYVYTIALNDGSTITFQYGLR